MCFFNTENMTYRLTMTLDQKYPCSAPADSHIFPSETNKLGDHFYTDTTDSKVLNRNNFLSCRSNENSYRSRNKKIGHPQYSLTQLYDLDLWICHSPPALSH